MRVLRALIIDDSARSRRLLHSILDEVPDVEVVGEASDGDEALMKVRAQRPDLLLLDLEMPRMDGFTFLRLLMARQPTPVIVVSGYSAKANVFKALELGALDFVAKPSGDAGLSADDLRRDLLEKVAVVRQLSPSSGRGWGHPLSVTGRFPRPAAPELPPPSTAQRGVETVVVIGASTGGPSALVEIFSGFSRARAAAVVVAQHMPPRFTSTFAQRLNRVGPLQVSEATAGATLLPGQGLVCPGGQCAEVVKGDGAPRLALVRPDDGDRYVPSVDRLFRSAAQAYGARVVAVVLTGMGVDGAAGARAVKDAGGTVICEAEESAVVFGMPAAAVRTGAVDRTLPVTLIAREIERQIDGS